MQNTLIKNYFTDISELMLFNWQHCQAGRIEYLRKGEEEEVKQSFLSRLMKRNKEIVYSRENDMKVWEIVQKDFVDRLGMPSHSKDFAKLQEKHTKAIYKYLGANDDHPQKRFFMNDVVYWQNEIEKALKVDPNTPKNTIEQTLLTLSKMEGRQLTIKNTSVLDFHLLINQKTN